MPQYLERIGTKNKDLHAKSEIHCSEALDISDLNNMEPDYNFSSNFFPLQGKYPWIS
jgi:hypothetical protein